MTSYRVPKASAVYEANHSSVPSVDDAEPKESKPARMLSAIVMRSDAAWFFKLQAPPEDVAEVEKAIDDFYAALSFSESGAAEWDLPESWSEKPGSATRFATLEVGEKELEMSVTRLGPQDLLANVNRWRKQLGQRPLGGPADLVAENGVKQVKLSNGETLYRIDITGTSSGGGMRPPFAPFMQGGGTGRNPHAGLPTRGSSPKPAGVTLKYELPDGWTEAPASPPRLATFRIGEGEKRAEVALFEFGPGNDAMVVSFVNIWIGEVGQTKLPADSDLGDVTESVKVAGMPGELLDVSEAGDDPGRKGITGIVIRGESKTWVVKLSGPREVVERERSHLDEFLGSIEVAKSEETGDGE